MSSRRATAPRVEKFLSVVSRSRVVHFPGRFLLVAVFVTSIVAMTVLLSVALPVEAADCLSERPRPQLLRPPLQRKHILFISRSRTKLQEACFESEDLFFREEHAG